MNSAAITTSGLTKVFGKNTAVDALTFDVKKGELFGLVGPDGAGKTTVMRLLAAIMKPTAGDAMVAGLSIKKEGERIKEKIGYMSQRFGLYEDLTVIENIYFYADLYEVPGKDRPARIERLLGFSNLTPFRNSLAGELSGGMKQKLGLACTLIHTPEILLLDEPTNGVDPVSRRDFWRILYDLLRKGVTIFVSTAYLDEAERCTKIGLMNKGRLLIKDLPLRVRKSFGLPMIELLSDNARASKKIIEGIDGVIGVSIYGDRLHVTLTGKEISDALVSALGNNGIAVKGLREIMPSIEDVFISMVQG